MKIPDYSQPNHLNPYAPQECHFFSIFASWFQGAFNIGAQMTANRGNLELADENNAAQQELQREAQAHADALQEKEFAYNSAEAEKARAFNAEEAEKSRAFNAQEAEKARLWNSEAEVMKRRAEAGLNTAVTGNGGTSSGGSSATASSSPASGPSASATPGRVVSPASLVTPTLQAPRLDGIADAVMDAIKLPAELKKLDADTKQSYEQANLLSEEVRGKQLDNIYQEIMNNNAPELFRQQVEQARENVSNTRIDTKYKDTQRRAIADKASREAFETFFQMATAMRKADIEAEQALFDVQMQIAEYDKAVNQYEEDWKRHAFKMSYDFGSQYHDTSQTNISVTDMFGGELSGSFGLGSSSSKSNSFSQTQGTNGKSKGNFTSQNMRGVNLASLVGVNGAFNATLQGRFETSFGSSQTLETINRFQLESLLHKATQLGAASQVLKNAKKSFEAERALSKIGDITEYFIKVAKLKELTNSLRIIDLENNPFMQRELEQ